ncbi:PHB depolymerase family esterase [Flammeovirga sp. MY04]|uniref:extracellular catalytic domain type 1 short-chain-length polyhydroxyalkanoate depolymerase n=1 Tax=Flammeovirga sp. MY04 TaxID=1191459 RepID=UPI00080639E0|nr:PHB depolymerase family esterase [Flammeovirga sp. MY04]ANQ52633.1 PHB depolymerase family esterase [Flammeovirga sp. MY04]
MKYLFLSFLLMMIINTIEAQHMQKIEDFGTNQGELDLYFYQPNGTDNEELPLLVVLHGCGQNAEEYAKYSGWNVLANQSKFRVIYPQQKLENQQYGCFNWYNKEDVTKGSGEVQSIAEMVDFIKKKHPTSKVFINGLSAGGVMANALLHNYPELFDAGCIIAGIPFTDGVGMAKALELMQKSTINWTQDVLTSAQKPDMMIIHGNKDKVVNVSNAEQLLLQFFHFYQLDPMRMERHSSSKKINDQYTVQVSKYQSKNLLIQKVIMDGLDHGLPMDHLPNNESYKYYLQTGYNSTLEIGKFFGLVEVEE